MDDNDALDPMEMDDFSDELDEDFDEYETIADGLVNPVVESVENTLDGFLASASVDAVYGEAVVQRDTLIIPAAEVISVMGFGVGGGQGGSQKENGTGGGGGGGGRVFSRPVAVIVSSPDGVRVEPVVDVTKIAMAGITALAFLLGMRSRFRRMRNALEDVE